MLGQRGIQKRTLEFYKGDRSWSKSPGGELRLLTHGNGQPIIVDRYYDRINRFYRLYEAEYRGEPAYYLEMDYEGFPDPPSDPTTRNHMEHSESVLSLKKGQAVLRSHGQSLVRISDQTKRAQKTACIIAAGEWGGSRALLKNRDRNYQPRISVYHEVRNGQEILYLKDEGTGWVEGLNASGIGVVNSALLVARDEAEKELIKSEGKKSKDGPRILRILEQTTLDGAVKESLSYKNGLMGHTFISDAKKAFSVEQTRKHEGVSKALAPKKTHVRTNHGFHYEDAGYAAGPGDSGGNYQSSVTRRNQAKKTLKGLASPGEIGPSLYRKRKKSLKDPNNMVRDTDKMRTSSQMILDLGKLQLLLYLIPGKVTYLGYKNKLPKGFKPKLSLKVYEYTDLDKDGDFDIALLKKDKKARLRARVIRRHRQASLQGTLKREFPGVTLWVEEDPSRGRVILHKIVVPKELRGRGLGRQVMRRLLKWADERGMTVSLTPSSDFGGSKTKLIQFYGSLGFVRNKGRTRDPEIYELMYRLPR